MLLFTYIPSKKSFFHYLQRSEILNLRVVLMKIIMCVLMIIRYLYSTSSLLRTWKEKLIDYDLWLELVHNTYISECIEYKKMTHSTDFLTWKPSQFNLSLKSRRTQKLWLPGLCNQQNMFFSSRLLVNI